MSTYKLLKTGSEIDAALNDVGTLATSVSALQTQVGELTEEISGLTFKVYAHYISFDGLVENNFYVRVRTTIYTSSGTPFTHTTLFNKIPNITGCYFVEPFSGVIGLVNVVSSTSANGFLFTDEERSEMVWSYTPTNFTDTVTEL